MRGIKVSILSATAILAVTAGIAVLSSNTPAIASTKTVTTKTGVVTHGGIVTTDDTIGWLLTCPVSHSLPDDPILYPGHSGHGMAHLHDFTGNASTNSESTLTSMEDPANNKPKDQYTGMLPTLGTTCDLPTFAPGTAGDTAAYWRPALYVNGVKLTPTVKDQLYYRAKPTFGVGFKPIPQDARLIVGSAKATSTVGNQDLVDGHIYWEDANGKKMNTIPSTSSFLLNVVFPSCWDGQAMDHAFGGTDNGHFTYAINGTCPSDFPVKVPQLSEKFKYDNAPSGTRELASMQNPNGRAPGYTAHADFWNTWNPVALQYLVTNCINARISCGTNPVTPLS
jgi:hypothetical protein